MRSFLISSAIAGVLVLLLVAFVPAPGVINGCFILPLVVFWSRRGPDDRTSVVIVRGAAAGVIVTLLALVTVVTIIQHDTASYVTDELRNQRVNATIGGAFSGILLSVTVGVIAGAVALFRKRPEREDELKQTRDADR